MSSVGTKSVETFRVQANHFPVSLKQAEVTRVQSVMRISLARNSLLHYWLNQGTRCPKVIPRTVVGKQLGIAYYTSGSIQMWTQGVLRSFKSAMLYSLDAVRMCEPSNTRPGWS